MDRAGAVGKQNSAFLLRDYWAEQPARGFACLYPTLVLSPTVCPVPYYTLPASVLPPRPCSLIALCPAVLWGSWTHWGGPGQCGVIVVSHVLSGLFLYSQSLGGQLPSLSTVGPVGHIGMLIRLSVHVPNSAAPSLK